MRSNKVTSTKKAPARKLRKSLESKLDEKIGGSPSRPEGRHYEGSKLGYSVDEVSGLHDLGKEVGDSTERDDEQLLNAQLTESGVDRVFAGRRREEPSVNDIADEEEDERLTSGEDPSLDSQLEIEDDQDLRFVPAQPPMKARRSL
jgi:hypothetical protein